MSNLGGNLGDSSSWRDEMDRPSHIQTYKFFVRAVMGLAAFVVLVLIFMANFLV